VDDGGGVSILDDGASLFFANISPTGRIKSIACGQLGHFGPVTDPDGGSLVYYWIEDMTDPGTAAWLTNVETNLPGILSTLTNGLNSYKINDTLGTFEKLL
ncbi:MAG: hypothetical protein LBU07_01100, partial [Coriobacteriales bacterium]|nr:hypothetical protein [Coriobacteriales bacterium]